MSTTTATASQAGSALTSGHRKVILASSLGTVFEWYDFYLYGSLAAIIAAQFFSGVNETTGFIFALLAFAAGFAVRPFGALVFGRMGDMVGRKYTFLVTIVIMGVSTFLVGVLPNYASVGIAAPIILVVLRMLQGLALGGEYGGAATYVAEHAPQGKRGLYTSFIQTTATVGLLLSLIVILGVREAVGAEAFADWGWRIPFLLSIVLLAISVWIRMQLSESPLFQEMKSQGKLSKAPLTESFFSRNGRVVLLALLGATAGQAVVWYAGQFYAMYFLTQSLKVDPTTTWLMIGAALIIGTPFFVFFGWLSDRIGRKKIVMAGCLIAALTYFPLFKALTHYANPAIAEAAQSHPAVVIADPDTCSFQFDPVGRKKFTSSCDIAAAALAKAGVPYQVQAAPGGSVAAVMIGQTRIESYEATGLAPDVASERASAFGDPLNRALMVAAYPEKADDARIDKPMVILILTILVLYVTMVYGPIAAWLVELFPTRIRYTSMSLPYHIGNGWFGGFLPTIAFALVAATGNIYYGLWYPVAIALMSFVIGTLFLRETSDVDITS
ncbi:MAG: MHS family MFS transporter [Pseudomonadota bacterium]|nr:MHS family MFS transporter [Pseudomonadota bacterium]